MNRPDTIAVLDFGGQYAHLIANRIRRLGVYSEIRSNETPAHELAGYKGLILSGGPRSVLEPGCPSMDRAVLELGIPVLGLCYGHQLIAQLLGGEVRHGTVREYGIARIKVVKQDPLFTGLKPDQDVWMSHGDYVQRLPTGFELLASSRDCATAAVGDLERGIFGVQFHPEVTDTPQGMDILSNFITACACERSWNTDRYLDDIITAIQDQCNGRKVFLLVSGGVDSTVAFALLNRALGPQQVLGLHIDNGLMRHEESESIFDYLRAQGFANLVVEDAEEDFLGALRGVSDPERKREIIGNMFLTVQQRAQEKLGLNATEWILGQGTIYPDTIESAGTNHADRIKTHHNRVDVILELIEKNLLVEPLAQLYKDEVRELGEGLGLPHRLVWRHPFPGPGLGVRALCSDGTAQAVDEGSHTAVAEIAAKAGYRGGVLPLMSVGVQGDSRTYAHPAWVAGPRSWDALEKLSTHLTNQVPHINRVVYALGPTTGNYRPVPAFLTKDRLDKLRRIDHAVTEILYRRKEYERIWQMPVVLLPLVNEHGNECVVLRPVNSQEAMTARFARLSDAALDDIIRVVGAIPGAGDILYDVTHKPPGTIEWE